MTNQEKMQKIYELTGVEPKLVANEDQRKWMARAYETKYDDMLALETNLIDKSGHDISHPDSEFKPHYPCEQLWDLLPWKINKYRLNISYNVMRYSTMNDGVEYSLKRIEIEDLLTALLDMVLWCIEEGYIKRGEG